MTELIFLLPAGFVAVLALLAPTRVSLGAFFGLLPFMNAYAAAGAAGLIFGRWFVGRSASIVTRSSHVLWVYGSLAFITIAIIQSVVVDQDIIRLIGETIQWMLAIAVFSLVLLERDPDVTRAIARGMCIGALSLGAAQILARALEIELTDDLNTVLLRSDANNYGSFYVLVGLVLIPTIMRDSWRPLLRNTLFGAGVLIIALNESRAQLMTALAVGLLSFVATRRSALLRSIVLPLAAFTITIAAVAFASVLASDPQSVFSLLNFETNYSNLERLALIVYSFDIFFANPFGMGIGTSSVVFPAANTLGSYPTPHNTLAMLIVEFGLVGALAYAVLAFVLMSMVVRTYLGREASGPIALGLLAATIFEAVFFNGIISIIFLVALAIALRRSPVAGHTLPVNVLVLGRA